MPYQFISYNQQAKRLGAYWGAFAAKIPDLGVILEICSTCRERLKEWSLRTFRVKLFKIGAKVVKSRFIGITFQMAEVLVSKRLFQEILERIHRLKSVPIRYG